MVFSVPLWSSDAKMSPATSAVIRGAGVERVKQKRAEQQQHKWDRQAAVVDVAAERDVVGPAAALQAGCDDEDDRHEDRGAEPEVGALLEAQLAQLPAVDRRSGRVHAMSPTSSVSAARPASAPASSVREKNRSSSVAD